MAENPTSEPLSLSEPKAMKNGTTLSSSAATEEGVVEMTREEALSLLDKRLERRLLLKVDLHVLAPVCILFFWAFIDRINLGYARLQGLEADLDMRGNDFNIALVVQLVTFIVFEIPSNLILRRVRPGLWLAGISIGWGFMTLGSGLVNSYRGLLVLRVFLGVFEAGSVPGAVYLTSMYYKRFELQKRMSVLFVANCVAFATGGLMAYGIANLNGVDGYRSWRFIYIIEGTITIGLSILLLFLIPDWPSEARFLSPAEKRLLRARQIAEDTGIGQMEVLNASTFRHMVTDWKVYASAIAYFGITGTVNATAFIPGIVAGLGYTDIAAQAYTVPIYVVAAALSFLAAVLGDYLHNRFAFCFTGVVLACSAFGVLLNQDKVSYRAQYGSLFLLIGGSYMTIPALWAWLSNNTSGHYKRAWSLGMQISFGNIAALVPLLLFVKDEAPAYTRAYSASLALMVIAGLVMILTEIGLWWENRQRDRGKRDWRLQLAPEEIRNMGDDHPAVRFTY